MPLTQLEENNLKTQIQLLKDIQSDTRMIEYYVSNEASKMTELMRTASLQDETYSMNRDDFKKVFNLLSLIRDVKSWDSVNEYSKSLSIKKEVNEKTLTLLTKTN